MACIDLPIPTIPTLPSPLSIGITLPPFAFNLNLCCKILPFSLAIPPIPLGISLNLPIIAMINEQIAIVQAFLDQLAIPCPKDLVAAVGL